MLSRIAFCLVAAFLAFALVVVAACTSPTAAPTATKAAVSAAPTKAAEASKPTVPAPTKAPDPTKQTAAPVKAPVTPVELRAGSSFPKGDFISDGLDRFASLVDEKTKGALTVRVFYGSLGTEQQLAQSVMSGSVDIGMMSNQNTARFSDAYLVLDLPFLFKGNDQMLKFLDTPMGRRLVERQEKDLDVKVLMLSSYGTGRDVQTRKKVLKTPADLKGMKIRTASTPVDLSIFAAWGANPTPVDWGQTYSALQQGVVDGCGIGVLGMYGNKMYEVLKYDIRLDYQGNFEPVFMNGKKLASLAPDHQKAIQEAGREAQVWHHKYAAERLDWTIKEMQTKHGVEVYTPTAEEYAQWTTIRDKVWGEVAEQMKGKIDLDLAKQILASG